MTYKEIAEIIRRGRADELQSLADTLYPPRPEPGTVVWWRRIGRPEWGTGIVYGRGHGIMHMTGLVPFGDIEWKPARILADDEVALSARLWTAIQDALSWYTIDEIRKLVERAEAERMEDNQ